MNRIKRCRVCSDEATGFNYQGDPSCQPCKVFFHRNAHQSNQLKCRFGGNCPITLSTRSKCTKCRLEKCFSIGMIKRPNKTRVRKSKKVINSQASIESAFEKELFKILSMIDLKSASNLPNTETELSFPDKQKSSFHLTPFEQSLIERIHRANKVFVDENSIANTRMATSMEELNVWPRVYIEWALQFCKHFPQFNCLNSSDQLALFKPFCNNMLTARFSFHICIQKNTGVWFANDDADQTVTMDMNIYKHRKHFKNFKIFEFQVNYNKTLNAELENDSTLYDLLCAQLVFYPREKSSISCQEFVKYQHAFYSRLLYKYLEVKFKNIQQANKKYCALMRLASKLDAVNENEAQIFKNAFDLSRMPAIWAEIYTMI